MLMACWIVYAGAIFLSFQHVAGFFETWIFNHPVPSALASCIVHVGFAFSVKLFGKYWRKSPDSHWITITLMLLFGITAFVTNAIDSYTHGEKIVITDAIIKGLSLSESFQFVFFGLLFPLAEFLCAFLIFAPELFGIDWEKDKNKKSIPQPGQKPAHTGNNQPHQNANKPKSEHQNFQ